MANNGPDEGSGYFLLQLPDSWEGLLTKSASFDSMAKGSEVLTLEYLKELQGQRNTCCVHKFNAGQYTSEHCDQFARYLSSLGHLLEKGDNSKTEALKFEWSSPLSGKGGKFWKLAGVQQELAMAQFLHAALLQARAYQCVDELMAVGAAGRVQHMSDEQRSAKATEASLLLRQAAGVQQHLAEVVAASMADTLPADRPAELCSGMASCMQQICLGEAQAVVCHRAEERGTSAATLAALHMGASDLFEAAAKALKEHTGQFNTVSDRLRRFIAVSSTLHMARSYKHQGRDLAGRQEAGQGEACCVAAQALVKDALAVAEVDAAWKTVLLQEMVSITAARQRIETERVGIYYQALPNAAPGHVAGTVMVKPVAYEVVGTAQEHHAGLALQS